MKKVFSFILIVTLLFIFSVGCSTSSGDKNNSDTTADGTTKEVLKDVKLNFYHGKQEAQETFESIFELFTAKYPNITVEQEIVTNEPAAVLRTRIATGEIPDLFSAGTEVMDIAAGDYLAELTNEAFLDNIAEEALKSTTFTDADGKTWALPIDGSCIGVYYNKEIFNNLDLEAPKTVQQLKNVCDVLKANDIYAFALSFKDAWTIKMASICAFSPAVYAKNLNWDVDRRAGDVTFKDSEGWKTTFELLELIYENGNTDTAFDTDYNGAIAMFAQGEAAMLANGLWALEGIRSVNADIDVGIMGLPVSDNPSDAKLHQFPDFSISASSSSENLDEAKLFLAFMTEKETAELWSNSAKLFSAVKGVSVNFDPVAEDVTKLINDGMICTQADRGWSSPFHPEFEKSLSSVLLDERTIPEILEYLDEEWDKAEKIAAAE